MVKINNLIDQAVSDAKKRRQQALESNTYLSDQEAQKIKGGEKADIDIILGYIIDTTNSISSF
jgi:CO dehydrogenase/acetyl-CoA synthase epsilon subunit